MSSSASRSVQPVACSNWPEVVAHIEHTQPFLSRLRVSSAQFRRLPAERKEELPSHIKITVASAISMAENSGKRLTLVVPRRGEGALWVATGAALGLIRQDFKNLLKATNSLEVGQKVKIDGDNRKIAIYEGEGEYRGVAKLKLRASDGLLMVPLSYWPRLQPTTTKRPPTRIPSAGVPRPDLLDELLGIESQGARHLFSTRVVLVAPVARMHAFAREAHCTPLVAPDATSDTTPASPAPSVELCNLFQWGALGMDGVLDIVSNGQIDAEPVLVLCPDLLCLRGYLRDQERKGMPQPLVILDGPRSFRHHLDVLGHTLDTGASVMALLERGEEDCAPDLEKREFGLWRWTPHDLTTLSAAGSGTGEVSGSANRLFTRVERAFDNYARHTVSECVCAHPPLDKAALELMALLDEINGDTDGNGDLEGPLFSALLYAGRRVHSHPESQSLFEARLQNVETAIVESSLWLTDEVRTRALALVSMLREAGSPLPTQSIPDVTPHDASSPLAKPDSLRRLIETSSEERFAVVLPDEAEAALARRDWKESRGSRVSAKSVTFCHPATVESTLEASGATHLIICGWLGAVRMRRLLDGCLAARITVLLYSFERGWLRGAIRRWGQSTEALSSARRIELLGMNLRWAPDGERDAEEARHEPLWSLQQPIDGAQSENKASDFDVLNLEVRLHVQRRALLARANRTSEETEPARLVEFADGYFAFVTDGQRLPLVNDLMRAGAAIETPRFGRAVEIPQKKGADLQPGDYVVFRGGAAGNLIRDLADLSLRRQGMGHMRELSRLWKVALREWVEFEKDRAYEAGERATTRSVVARLQQAGVPRGEQTIMHWLERDTTIGPGNIEDVGAIARITEHEGLNGQLSQVIEAISRVRGSHLSASDNLARALMARLPQVLLQHRGQSPGSLEIEVESVGRAVVVRVEEVGSEPVGIPRSQLNVLRREAPEVAVTTSGASQEAEANGLSEDQLSIDV